MEIYYRIVYLSCVKCLRLVLKTKGNARHLSLIVDSSTKGFFKWSKEWLRMSHSRVRTGLNHGPGDEQNRHSATEVHHFLAGSWIRGESIGSDRIGSNRIGSDRIGWVGSSGSDRIGSGRIGSDRIGSDRMDRIRSDRINKKLRY